MPGRLQPDTSLAINTFMTRPAPIIPWQLSVAAARKIAALRPETQRKVMGENAIALYRLTD